LADAKLGLGAPSMSFFAFEAKLGFLNLKALILGLDSGIHAGMTAYGRLGTGDNWRNAFPH